MNSAIRTLLSALANGAVIKLGADGVFFAGDDPVDDALVADCLRKGWIFPTRRPVVSGTSLTGRLVISNMGRRALSILRRAA